MRIVAFILGGALFSLGIFSVVSHMVSSKNSLESVKSKKVEYTFIREKREKKTEYKKRAKPKKEERQKEKKELKFKVKESFERKTTEIDLKLPKANLELSNLNILGDARVGGISDIALAVELIPIVKFEPKYPKRAKQLKKEGYVKAEFTITKEGRVRDIKIVEESPKKIFRRSVINALKRWKFRPKIVGKKAVSQRAILKFDFKLDKL